MRKISSQLKVGHSRLAGGLTVGFHNATFLSERSVHLLLVHFFILKIYYFGHDCDKEMMVVFLIKILIREVADRERALAYFLREQECQNTFKFGIDILAHIHINIFILLAFIAALFRVACLPGATVQDQTLPISLTCTCRHAGKDGQGYYHVQRSKFSYLDGQMLLTILHPYFMYIQP